MMSHLYETGHTHFDPSVRSFDDRIDTNNRERQKKIL
jgi:hypothetical protein